MNHLDKCLLSAAVLVVVVICVLLFLAAAPNAADIFCKENGYEFRQGGSYDSPIYCYRTASTGLLERKAIVCINDGLSCNYKFVSDVVS